MMSETLADGLAQYGIGKKIRALRAAKKLGLVQLGKHSGLSSGMLSKIERGQIVPTLPTLLRIAMVFGVGLDHFFGASESGPIISVVRQSERLKFPDRPGTNAPSYLFESLNFTATNRRMDAYVAEFPVGADASEPHSHPGAELIYVVRGALALTVDEMVVVLDEGDAAYFESDAAHSYLQSGECACSAIVVLVA